MVKILVVEDEHIVAMDLQNRLRSLGYEVPETASSGEQAIEKAGRIRPDLVLMDIFLSGDMDGIEAASKIRALYSIPIIYITAYADSNTLQRAKVTEPFGYILKPFEEREMLTNIEMAIYKHRMDSRIKESERWLSTMLRSMGDGVIATNETGGIRFINPVAQSLTGWSEEAAAGRGLREVFTIVAGGERKPLELPGTGAQDSMAAEIDLPAGSLLVSRDGRETPVDGKATPIKDDTGKTAGIVLIFSDVTEDQRAEQMLRSKNRELEIFSRITSRINRQAAMEEKLAETLRDALELLEIDAGAIYLNEEDGTPLGQLSAVAARTEAGKSIGYRQVLREMAWNPENITTTSTAIFEGVSTAIVAPISVRGCLIGIMAFYSVKGDPIGADRSAMLLGIGSQAGIAVENHRLFKNIQATNSYLADIINESPDAVVTVDLGGFIASFNKSAARLLKYDAGDIIGRHITSLLPEDSEIDLGIANNYVREFKCKDGTIVTLNISTSTIFREGHNNGFIVTLKDLSEIAGLKIAPHMEKAVETAQLYSFEKGGIYLFDRSKGNQGWEAFADQVKHNVQGLCLTRQNPKKIREQYGLEKTPIIWLTGTDDPQGEITMKADNLTSLTATIIKFISGTKHGLVLIDGMEYLVTRNGFEAVLKVINFLNDKVMQSDCTVICCLDPMTLEDRQHRMLLTEMQDFYKGPQL